MCARCKELEATIERLEAVLARSVTLEDIPARQISKTLGLSPDQGRIAYLLYVAKAPLRAADIDQLLPVASNTQQARRLDSEFRTEATIRSQISYIRGKLGPAFVGSGSGGKGKAWEGYFLSPAGKQLVKAALDA